MMDLTVQSSQTGRAIADLGFQTQAASVASQQRTGREVVTYNAPSTQTQPPPRTTQSQTQTQSTTAATPATATQEGIGHYPERTISILREEDISDFMLENAFSGANRALAGGSFSLSYVLHEATNMVAVSVLDSETGEVIREIPPESRLDLYARIAEFTGLLFDQSS